MEQSKPYKEAAGESQRSHSGSKEDPRVSPTYQSAPGFIHTGQTVLKSSRSHLVILKAVILSPVSKKSAETDTFLFVLKGLHLVM